MVDCRKVVGSKMMTGRLASLLAITLAATLAACNGADDAPEGPQEPELSETAEPLDQCDPSIRDFEAAIRPSGFDFVLRPGLFDGGEHPSAMAVDQFGGDFRRDIAVASRGGGRVLMHPGGRLVHGVTTPMPVVELAGWIPVCMTSADFDSDGNVDLALTAEPEDSDAEIGLFLLWNNGDFSFDFRLARDAYAIGEAESSIGPVGCPHAADFDGDGNFDIAVASGITAVGGADPTLPGNARISFLRWAGARSFGGWVDHDGYVDYTVPVESGGPPSFALSRPYAIATAKLNDDDHLDIIVTDGGDKVVVLLPRSDIFDGRIVSGYALDGLAEPRSLGVGDFDGDGDDDIVVANTGEDSVTIFENTRGEATVERLDWRRSRRITVGADPRSLTIADLDGDFDLDVAVASYDENKISVLLNEVQTELLDGRDAQFAPPIQYFVGRQPGAIAAVHLSSVRFPDLATADFLDNRVTVLANLSELPDSLDCNENGIPDECDIRDDPSLDANGNGVLAECEMDWPGRPPDWEPPLVRRPGRRLPTNR